MSEKPKNTLFENVFTIILAIIIALIIFGIWYLLRKSGSELAYSKNDYVYYFKIDDSEYYVDPIRQKLSDLLLQALLLPLRISSRPHSCQDL